MPAWRRSACLFAILVLALGLRAAYAWHGVAHPEWRWQEADPDRYAEHGAMLVRDGEWRWTLDSVRFTDGAKDFIKSPFYQIFLSIFARFTPAYPKYVPFGHALLGAVTALGVFVLARALHSTRAGLIGAALHATWFMSIVSVNGRWQEHLYIPLFTMATAFVVRSVGPDGRGTVAAGVMLAAAALTRSMVLWLAPLTLLWRRWRALAVCAALLVPYVAYLSISLDRFVVLENVGAAYVALNDPEGVASPREPQPLRAVPGIVAAQIVADPVHYARALVFHVRKTMTISGHRWLEFIEVLPDERTAVVARWVVVISELPVVAVLLLAPFGVAAASNRRAALLVAAWVAIALLFTAVAGHQGPRFRAPLDPLLIALASCVLAGALPARKGPAYSSPVPAYKRSACMAACASAALGVSVAVTIPHAAKVRGDFGITRWTVVTNDTRTANTLGGAAAGFGIHPEHGEFILTVRCLRGPTTVTIVMDGHPGHTIQPADCVAGAVVRRPAHGYTYIYVSMASAIPVEVAVKDDHISPEMMAFSRGTHLAFQAQEWDLAGCARAPRPSVHLSQDAPASSCPSSRRSRCCFSSPRDGSPGSVMT